MPTYILLISKSCRSWFFIHITISVFFFISNCLNSKAWGQSGFCGWRTMSDTKDKSNRSIGQRGSSSRLSASAKPFNWSTHVKEYDFGQQSFSSFSLFDYGGCYDQSLHSDSNAMPSSFPKATQDAIFGDHFSLLSCNEFPRQGILYLFSLRP